MHEPSTTAPVSSPLKVLVWYRRGVGLHFSGPGRTAFRMYSKADPSRVKVSVAHGNPSHQRYDLFAHQYLVADCPPRPIPQLKFLHHAKAWLREHANQFDIMHALSGYMVSLGPAAYAHQLGLPAVLKLIAWRADMEDKQLWKRWLGIYRRRREKLAKLDAVIAISPAIREELLEYGVPENKIASIPNGVDVELFEPVRSAAERQAARAEFGWPDMPTVIFAGGINRRKRPHLIIEAIALLKKQGLDAQLVLAGPFDDAVYRNEMRALAAARGIQDRLHWLGFVEQIAPLYRAAEMSCLPSRLEGLPNSVLESMASGIPCLVTKIPGSVDLVDDQVTGRHVDPTGESIAVAIADYLDSPSIAQLHGQAARNKAESQYDVSQVMKAHEHLFQAIVHGDR